MEHYVTNYDATLRDDTAGISIQTAIYRPKMAGLLLRVAAEAQTPNFEPIELLVPLVLHPRTAAVACFMLKKLVCKVWACNKGGPVGGQSPRHGFRAGSSLQWLQHSIITR